MLDNIFLSLVAQLTLARVCKNVSKKNSLLLVSQVAGGGCGQEVEGCYPACRSCPILEAAIRRPKDRLKI